MYDRYYWLGVYTFFKKEYHPEIINNSNKATSQALLSSLYLISFYILSGTSIPNKSKQVTKISLDSEISFNHEFCFIEFCSEIILFS